ncbi:helix-turn-helix transcriptional regulator [Roseibium sp. SCP14]|uniref:helix-turn-helix transcriptional regulator n=1 Tax=Roseibium sp. SCP14 TaxID=3141375 RepID=UPI00333BEF76
MSHRAPSKSINFANAISACGTGDFQSALLEAIRRFLHADTCGVLQYSRYSMPYYLLRDSVPEQEIDLYLSGAYRFDPFFRYWRQTGKTGVVSLGDLSVSTGHIREDFEDYLMSFHPRTGMADELALLSSKIGSAVDNYFFLRREKFTPDELSALEDGFPAIQALCDLNLKLLLNSLKSGGGTAFGFPGTDSFLIEDSSGHRLFASEKWDCVVGSNITLSDAVEKARRSHPGEPELLTSGHVVSEKLHEDFPLAPGGRITFVVLRQMASASLDLSEVVKQVFKDRLTAREFSICSLAVRGFPTTIIAEKLGISSGTVKNHRKRIYRKLDITTERELFLMVLNHLEQLQD